MYERFFGFRDQPFRLTPDPKYLYLGNKHREGYAHLLYALREGSGFVAVTGEVGTGKTTLVRALLRESHSDVAVAYIFNPLLSSVELLQTINAELGLPSRSTSKKELTENLNNFLLAHKADGGRTIVIVDEAQNLDPAVLEQLRLLSNFETETDKLLQIILLGQPELRLLLERPDLRQLSQRISLRWHLEPLDRIEVHEYVQHRVQVAGGPESLFDPRALDIIAELSGGVPRLINILAHRALLVAYTKNARRVGPAELQLAAAELEQCRIPLRPRAAGGGQWAMKAAAGLAVAVAAGAVAFLLVAPLGEDGRTTAAERELAAAAAERSSERRKARDDGGASGERDADGDGDAKRADNRGRDSGGRDGERRNREREREDAADGAEERTARASASPAAGGSLAPAAGGGDKRAARDERETAEAIEKLARRLVRTETYDAAAGAMSRLVELWTGRVLTPAEISSGSLDLQLFGARRGLRYLSAELTPQQLEKLDLPAVVELRVGDGENEESRFVLVESLDHEAASLYLDKPYRVDRRGLEALWSGSVHLLWRDAERLSRPLSKGTSGPAVEKLQTLLAEAGYLEGSPTGEYDDATQQAVRRLQAARGLHQSGDATTLTQIILYNVIERFERPDLRSEGDRLVARSDS